MPLALDRCLIFCCFLSFFGHCEMLSRAFRRSSCVFLFEREANGTEGTAGVGKVVAVGGGGTEASENRAAINSLSLLSS